MTFENILIVQTFKADFVDRVSRVGDQFAKEYFTVGIEGMGDEVRITSYNVCYTKLLRRSGRPTGGHRFLDEMGIALRRID